MSQTILKMGVSGETGRINYADMCTVTGRSPVTFAESAAVAAGV